MVMQLSESFRRGIVFPLDDQAEAEVRRWQASDASRFRFLAIKSDADFYAIWRTGMFSALNKACASVIDDYEEEILEPDVLGRAVAVLSKEFASLPAGELRQFRDNLLALIIEAGEKSRPVVFVL
jgi:hypothetical protein